MSSSGDATTASTLALDEARSDGAVFGASRSTVPEGRGAGPARPGWSHAERAEEAEACTPRWMHRQARSFSARRRSRGRRSYVGSCHTCVGRSGSDALLLGAARLDLDEVDGEEREHGDDREVQHGGKTLGEDDGRGQICRGALRSGPASSRRAPRLVNARSGAWPLPRARLARRYGGRHGSCLVRRRPMVARRPRAERRLHLHRDRDRRGVG